MTAYLLSHLQLTTGDSVIGEKNLILDLFLWNVILIQNLLS